MVAPYSLQQKRLIGVENNAGGQFARLLKSELDLAVDRSVLKYDGDCFYRRGTLSSPEGFVVLKEKK